jgi:hypothetical protein
MKAMVSNDQPLQVCELLDVNRVGRGVQELNDVIG